MRELMFVSCTEGAKEDTRLYASLRKLGIADFRFAEYNRRGLSLCYNAWLNEFVGTNRILVMVHDDVTIADVFIREKIEEAARIFDVVGLVGSALFELATHHPRYDWGVWPDACRSGAVEHCTPQGLAFWSYFGPTPQRCVVLDGLFLAVDMLTIRGVRFDERFAFHLYDLDFCLAAHRANLVCGTTNIYVQHASQGDYASPAYLEALERFQHKWSAVETEGGQPLRIRVDAPGDGAAAAADCIAAGDRLLEAGFAEEALEQYRQAWKVSPGNAALISRVGRGVELEEVIEGLVADLRRQVLERPDDALAHFRLGKALQEIRNNDGARACYERALALEPRYVAAMNNLGMVCNDTGDMPAAIACYRQAVAMAPEVAAAHSNLVYSLHFLAGTTAEDIYREHRQWALRHAAPLGGEIRPHDNEPRADKRLRVGYISPNFYEHPVGRMLAGLFEGHDHDAVEVVCYYASDHDDHITSRLRRCADAWVDVAALSDAALAERIRADRVDVLVDLTMHMARNRLLAFARKPAPVQATYLAYCSTTGLDTIDYRLTDAWLDPPERASLLPREAGESCGEGMSADTPGAGSHASVCSEKSIYLPSYWCYSPAPNGPPVNELPALTRGHVTFASLNNFAKVSPAAMALWARILAAVPGSELIVHACVGRHRQRMQSVLAAAGVDAARVRFFDRLEHRQYLALHHAIDIALDAFPYSGGTTTCDALWMGVPTVSLYGEAAFTRGGLSILSAAGVAEWAVDSEGAYLARVIELAGDLAGLARVRGTLRDRMGASMLMDTRGFARSVEGAYRQMWEGWCAGAVGGGR